jgi:hypothetical protein
MAGEGAGTSTRGVDQKGTRTRGKEPPQPSQGLVKDPEARLTEQFMGFLEEEPKNRRSAPQTLTLPRVLFEDMMRQINAAFEDGFEHGGLFGYQSSRSSYGIVFAQGKEDKTDFSEAYSNAARMRPPLTIVGRFHTHMTTFGLGQEGSTGRQGGGPSEQDLTNFFTRPKASAVVSYTQKGGRKIYLLIRPKGFNVKTPEVIAKKYQETVIKRAGKTGDLDEASEKELAKLATNLDFVFYTNLDSRVLKRR